MGRDKNSIGNRGLKELICTTHGHELSGGGNAGDLGKAGGQRGDKGEKIGKTNSIINKKYFKKFI